MKDKDFFGKVKEMRFVLNMSREEVAKRLKTNPFHIRRIEEKLKEKGD